MKAIQIRQPGPPAVMEYVDLPTPTPGPGEVLIRTQSIGVGVGTLAELIAHLRGEIGLPVQPTGTPVPAADGLSEGADFADIKGQIYT